jgi:hypothetical protein
VIDQQDRHSLLGEEFDPLLDLCGDLRREADARLVDQAQPRAHQVGLGEFEHFLLAAGKVAGLVFQLELERWKFLEHLAEARVDVDDSPFAVRRFCASPSTACLVGVFQVKDSLRYRRWKVDEREMAPLVQVVLDAFIHEVRPVVSFFVQAQRPR